MKRLSFTRVLVLLFALLCLFSCGKDPVKVFTDSLRSCGADKVISQSEMETLNEHFQNALKKKRSGIKVGTKVIKTEVDLISYMESRKWTVEGPVSEESIAFSNLYIFLENSRSMQGYVNKGNADFQEPILALTHSVEASTSITTAYIGGKNGKSEVCTDIIPQDKFLSNISNGSFPVVDSSPLDMELTKAVGMIKPEEGQNPESVFCFITDGILSGTNAEIARNKEFTINNLPLLEDRIRQAMEVAKENRMDCLVYRLQTEFNGVYFDYKNGHHNIHANRPYLMILVGHKENLKSIETKLGKESNFNSKDKQRFSTYDAASTVSTAQLSRVAGANGTTSKSGVLYDRKRAKDEPVMFKATFNFNSLPALYLDTDYIENSIMLQYLDKVSQTEVEIKESAEWVDSICLTSDTKMCSVVVRIEPEYLSKIDHNEKVKIVLPGTHDPWYKDHSSSNDLAIYNGDDTTFSLDRFMGGIMKAFKYDDSSSAVDAVSYSFSLKTK